MAVSVEHIWADALVSIRSSLGDDAWRNWIAPLEIVSIEGTVVHLAAPSSFIGNWVARNYGDEICRQISAVGRPVSRVMMCESKGATEVEADAPKATNTPQPKGNGAAVLDLSAARAKRAAEHDGAPLDSRFTFENFVVGKPNELAHAAAKRVSEGGPVSFNPLFLYGGTGLGKTHLMHAIAWEIQERQPGARVLFLSAEQFMYRFVQALRTKTQMDFKQLHRSVDLLMIDDVQFIAGKESTQEEFFHTFNALVDHGKQLVISGDRPPVEMDGMEDRIKSRLQWGLVADIHPTDYELRLGILQTKADGQRERMPNLKIAPGVLEYLAHRISSNVRVLEGSLTRLTALADLTGREVTMDMVQDTLSDTLRASERKVTPEEIIRKVCEHFNVKRSDMLSAKRARAIARPRQVAMYLSKNLTPRSLPDIGRAFGGRDHTTVIHAVKKVDELMKTDSELAEDVEMLRRLLEA
ncbi:chromosomal replication initiator protein DnaA [Paracoccaceae bacterium GXU_MW_L88]